MTTDDDVNNYGTPSMRGNLMKIIDAKSTAATKHAGRRHVPAPNVVRPPVAEHYNPGVIESRPLSTMSEPQLSAAIAKHVEALQKLVQEFHIRTKRHPHARPSGARPDYRGQASNDRYPAYFQPFGHGEPVGNPGLFAMHPPRIAHAGRGRGHSGRFVMIPPNVGNAGRDPGPPGHFAMYPRFEANAVRGGARAHGQPEPVMVYVPVMANAVRGRGPPMPYNYQAFANPDLRRGVPERYPVYQQPLEANAERERIPQDPYYGYQHGEPNTGRWSGHP